MKVRFFQRLNTRLSLIPLFLMLVSLIAVGIGFYVFGYPFLKDFHKSHLINLSSEKRALIDAWKEDYRSDLEDLSRSSVVRDSAAVLTSIQPSGKYKKKIAEQINEAELNISGLFREKVLSDKYKMLSLLSKDGRVISSSKHEIAGEDWSGRDFFRDMVPGLKSPNIIGFQEDDSDYIMGFLSPIFDANGEMAAIIYAEVDVKGLADILKIEKNLYKSEKIELIDKDGNIVLTREGAYAKKIRYNIPGDSQNIVRYKDGIFFYVVDLEQAPFRLITTVKKSEVARPFTILLIMYLSFAGVVILLTVMQNAYLAKRLITMPVSKLIHATRSVAAGDLSVDIGKGYKGELLELKKSFESMIEELRERESTLRENIRTKEMARLKEGMLAISQEEFNMCELLEEIEDAARNVIGTKEIELIADCQDVFLDKPVYTDRQRLRQILTNLVINAVISTKVGTVTVLCSEVIKNGMEYIEVSVADTGAGIEPEMMERIFEEFSDYLMSSGLFISKKLTDALGGRIDVESALGKGSVFTVTIPVKAIVYK